MMTEEVILWLGDFFREAGYRKLHFDAPGMTAFFQSEPGCVTVFVIADAQVTDPENAEGSGADLQDQYTANYQRQIEKIRWRFTDAHQPQAHVLTLLVTPDQDRGLALSKEDGFCWIVDTAHHALVIPEQSVEDFYGIKQQLTEYMGIPRSGSRYMEPPLEYGVDGKLCYQGVLQRPIVNHALLVLNLIGYVLCILFAEPLYDWGDLRFGMVLGHGQWYRMLTCMFLHADPAHLTGNMLILLLMGDMTERALGHIRYTILYFAGGILAGALSMCVAFLKGSVLGSVGASGAIFAVVGAFLWVLLRNHGKIEEMTTKKILFLIAYSLYFGLTSTGVDNAAHIGGLVGGFLLGICLYRKKRTLKKISQGE